MREYSSRLGGSCLSDSPSDIPNETQTVRGPADEEMELPVTLAVLPLRDAVVYPGVTVQLSVGRQ